MLYVSGKNIGSRKTPMYLVQNGYFDTAKIISANEKQFLIYLFGLPEGPF
jgi:hypothetical protein